MIYVPPLHAELMSTTALTPTHHKGGGLRMVVGIVAAIAIPYAAPALAGSIGTSLGISAIGSTIAGVTTGTVLGSALVGAGLGAGLAAITGRNPLLGAAGGAFAGGLAGFAEGGGFSGIGGRSLIGPDDFTGLTPAQLGGAPAATSAAGLSTTAAAPSFDFQTGLGAEFDAFGTRNPFADFQTGVTTDVVPTLSNQLSGPSDLNLALDQGGFSAAQLSAAGEVAPLSTAGGNLFPQTAFSASDPGFAYDYPTQSYTASDAGRAAAVTRAPARAAAASAAPQPQPPGFLDDLTTRLGEGVTKAFSPENLAQKGLEAAGQFGLSKAAEYFADEVPVSREEEAQLAFLSQQRAEQARLQGEREDIATGFLSQARGLSATGQEEANAAKIAAARAGQSFIREGVQTPAAVASRQRQVNLAAARAGGTAQVQGRTSAETERARLFTLAANTLPTGSALATGAQADLAAAEKRFLRQQEEQKNFSSQFGGLLPTGAETAEERAEKIKKELGIK